MIRQDLSGVWSLRDASSAKEFPAKVPGSLFQSLLATKEMSDPYWRDNEEAAREFARHDWVWSLEFDALPELFDFDRRFLRFLGIDTYAEVSLNGEALGCANNMHRTWEFELDERLKPGMNRLEVKIRSPIPIMEAAQESEPLWGQPDTMTGFSHVRKAHCMFGWDWGPKLPDSGLCQPVYIEAISFARFEGVSIRQRYEGDRANIDIGAILDRWNSGSLSCAIRLFNPKGEKVADETVASGQKEFRGGVSVDGPELWWPNGLGAQPLYTLEVELCDGERILDSRFYTIGIRTLTLRLDHDEWGESFRFEVNGTSFFAMGANYIPEDSVWGRRSPERTRRLLEDAALAGFNCIRVWGGGSYPEDWFYNECDRLGLVVWQDFMFACAQYQLTADFSANVREEAREQIRRLRHRTCIGLWCGNNELEVAWVSWDFPKPHDLRADYLRLFERILPQILREEAPDANYWPSSPSSGGGFDKPNDENRGDVHYWDVWHGLKPFSAYRDFKFRFVSEFGFQSFPSIQTVRSFTELADRNPFSRVMEAHQKNGTGNGKILYYMSEWLKYPKDFDSFVYASQIVQAEAIRYGAEHWRRNRGRCMGALYWQLNDCWPVASWSSIDYEGRWKALHYFAKRFFATVAVSAEDTGTSVLIFALNEGRIAVEAGLSVELCGNDGRIMREWAAPLCLEPQSSRCAFDLDLASDLADPVVRRSSFLRFALRDKEAKLLSQGSCLFVKPKHFEFQRPFLEAIAGKDEDGYWVSIKAKSFASRVEISLRDSMEGPHDIVLEDNYVDVWPGWDRKLRVLRLPPEILSIDELAQAIVLRSIFDIA